MPEPGYKQAEIEAHIQVALMVWAVRPDICCRDCRRVGRIPTQIRRNGGGPAWTVESSSREEDGWLHLEEHVPSGPSYDIKITLLCPKCRSERSL